MERVMGIEPTSSAWKAEVLPLNYTRPAGATPKYTLQYNHAAQPIEFRAHPHQLYRHTQRLLTSEKAHAQSFKRSSNGVVEGVGFEPT
jgi:hypothetical protein